MHDDYEFVVFSDGRTDEMHNAIKKTCERLKLRCVRILLEIHARPYLQRFPGEGYNDPSCRTANVIQYSLDVLGFYHQGIVAIVDSDMFLIKDFSIADHMENYDICVQLWRSLRYWR